MEELGAAVEGFDGVGAGEDEPVVGAEAGEGGVEGGEGGRGDDLDGGDEDGDCAEGFELGGELGGLVAGSGDQDAFVLEGHLVVIVVGRVLDQFEPQSATINSPGTMGRVRGRAPRYAASPMRRSEPAKTPSFARVAVRVCGSVFQSVSSRA